MAAFGALLPVAPGATFGRSCPKAAPPFTLKRSRTPASRGGALSGYGRLRSPVPDIIVQD